MARKSRDPELEALRSVNPWPCPACGGKPTLPLSRNGYVYVRCGECGVVPPSAVLVDRPSEPSVERDALVAWNGFVIKCERLAEKRARTEGMD